MAMNELLTGAVTGILFGFLMQKAQVIRYDRQLAALRLQDMTIVKFMLTTILVAMVGIYLLFDLGLIKLSVKPLILGGNVLGGLIFGIGWGIVGYCPATAMGALGEGRYDSVFGLLGMILGPGFYAEVYPSDEGNGPDLGGFREDHPAGRSGHQPLDRHRHPGCGLHRPLLLVREEGL